MNERTSQRPTVLSQRHNTGLADQCVRLFHSNLLEGPLALRVFDEALGYCLRDASKLALESIHIMPRTDATYETLYNKNVGTLHYIDPLAVTFRCFL